MSIALADVGFVDYIHKWIQREPINSVSVITAHKAHNLGSYADIIPDVELIDFPTRLPLAANLITVQITDDWTLKTVIPTVTVIAVLTLDVNIRIGDDLVQQFEFRPMLILHFYLWLTY